MIVAPCDGTTGRKDIHEGQLVSPGQTMVDIVDETDVWVVANYRETQLANIAIGAPVTMTVDGLAIKASLSRPVVMRREVCS